jgi:hypothetical protein
MHSRLNLRFKVFGLCAVLGLMAFAAATAHAEKGAKWTLLNSKGELSSVTTALLPTGSGTLESSTGSLLFTTGGGTKVAFTCSTGALVGSVKLLEEGSTSEGQIKFTSCKTFLNGSESKPCEPHTGATNGEVITRKGTGLIKLHLLAGGAVDSYVLVSPTVGNIGAVIELGEECSIGEAVTVEGAISLIDCQNEFAVHKVSHLAEEFPALRGLKALGQPATVDGSALVFLGGAHEGLKVAALASSMKP